VTFIFNGFGAPMRLYALKGKLKQRNHRGIVKPTPRMFFFFGEINLLKNLFFSTTRIVQFSWPTMLAYLMTAVKKKEATVPLLRQQQPIAITVDATTDAELLQAIESAKSRDQVRSLVHGVVGAGDARPLLVRLYPNQPEKQIFLHMLLQQPDAAVGGFLGFLVSHCVTFGLLCILPCLMIYTSASCLASWEHDVFLWVFCSILAFMCFVCLKYWGEGPFTHKLTVPILISGALINPCFSAACWVMFMQVDYPYCKDTAKSVTQVIACASAALFGITILVICYYRNKK